MQDIKTMEKAPNSVRLSIAIFGRTNAGKSTLLNRIAGQDSAITSPIPGTTTDAVTKAMELRPLGPILLIDTAGLDDPSRLGAERMAAARRIYDRADVVLLTLHSGTWGNTEEEVLLAAQKRGIKTIAVITHADQSAPQPEYLAFLKKKTGITPVVASEERDQLLNALREALLEAAPDDFLKPPPLLGDLIQPGEIVVLLIPIDKQAPAGRLILPQAHAIRDALDHGAIPMVCRESEYRAALDKLKGSPALVICDSQVVDQMVRETPEEIPCTTFSILFSRLKGDIASYAAGCAAISTLRPGDRVLIAEGCTHHSSEVDIGRVQIPRLLEKKAGGALHFTVYSGHDYPPDLATYQLIIHCGGCMLNRRETLRRIALAAEAGVPITNFGMAISTCRGVLDRVMKPFTKHQESL